MLFLQKPRYYDAPDGEAPIDKIVATSKKGFVGALVMGIADCVWITDTKNALQTANCLAHWIVPVVGMSAMWASVTYMTMKIRGKDDKMNYVTGAVACSPILHAWKKSTPITLWGTAGLVFLAVLAKAKVQYNWVYFPEIKHHYGIYGYDLTIIKDYDKDFRSPYRFT